MGVIAMQRYYHVAIGVGRGSRAAGLLGLRIAAKCRLEAENPELFAAALLGHSPHRWA
jgi:hypothetical protein